MHLTLLHAVLASSVCWLLGRYATAVNAEKKETSDKIRRKVDEMTEKMKQSSKFTTGNIQELKEAMEALFECRRTVKFFYVKQVCISLPGVLSKQEHENCVNL